MIQAGTLLIGKANRNSQYPYQNLVIRRGLYTTTREPIPDRQCDKFGPR